MVWSLPEDPGLFLRRRRSCQAALSDVIREHSHVARAFEPAASLINPRNAYRSPCMILTACIAGGCGAGDGLDRRAISGSVTLDGQPLSEGTILLEPVTDRSGTAVGATIRCGAFAITRVQGPVPGSYRVRIYASSGVQDPPVRARPNAPAADGRTAPRRLQYTIRAACGRVRSGRESFPVRPPLRGSVRFAISSRSQTIAFTSPSVFRHPRGLPRWETGDEASP